VKKFVSSNFRKLGDFIGIRLSSVYKNVSCGIIELYALFTYNPICWSYKWTIWVHLICTSLSFVSNRVQINFIFPDSVHLLCFNAMSCIHKILKFTHKMQKHLIFYFNFHLGVYGVFPVRPVSIVVSFTKRLYTSTRGIKQRFICTPFYSQ
jgi:hypothetical protein